MKKLHYLAMALLLAMVSCSNVLNKQFNEDTVKEDFEEISKTIDSNDLKLLMGSVFRLKFKKTDLSTMTYGEIMADGKKWKAEKEKEAAEEKALAEEAARKEAERVKKLSETVVVTVFEKGFEKANYKSYISMTFAIKNKTDKTIRALKGSVIFSNLFDEKIKEVNVVYDQPVSGKSVVNWEAYIKYNQFKDEDVSLKNKLLKDLKVSWVPEKVIFEDGTTLE